MDQTLSLTREDVQQRIAVLGWSQNELARRIKKNPGYVSGVLSGKWTSGVVWGRIAKELDREEARREKRRNGDAGA
jgi:ribosome-binding protein aMBF1 (putative translation factor)